MITLYTINGIAPDRIEPFQKFIGRLLTEDIERALHRAARTQRRRRRRHAASGMGFLTMLNDYGARSAWKFGTPRLRRGDEVAVTTMVRCRYRRRAPTGRDGARLFTVPSPSHCTTRTHQPWTSSHAGLPGAVRRGRPRP